MNDSTHEENSWLLFSFHRYIFYIFNSMFSSWGVYEGTSNIRCNSWNLQLLISRCSNVILSVGGETPAFQRILFMLLQTLAVTGYLNMWWIEIFKENVKIWFIELLDMGQWSASQNRLDRAEDMSLLIFLRLIKCIYIQIYIKVVVHIDQLWIFLFTGIIC